VALRVALLKVFRTEGFPSLPTGADIATLEQSILKEPDPLNAGSRHVTQVSVGDQFSECEVLRSLFFDPLHERIRVPVDEVLDERNGFEGRPMLRHQGKEMRPRLCCIWCGPFLLLIVGHLASVATSLESILGEGA
jgi:hypothetical protein